MFPETVPKAQKRQSYISRKDPRNNNSTQPTMREIFLRTFQQMFLYLKRVASRIVQDNLKILLEEHITIIQISKCPIKTLVWGTIVQRDARPLCIVVGTVNSVNGFLLEMTQLLNRNGWHLQQDNARCHSSAYTQAWIHQQLHGYQFH